MSELRRFQDAFTAALAGEDAGLAPWSTAGPGLAVYRNTIAKGLIDALRAQFPTVERAAGEAWMAEAARRYSREHPPAGASLLAYGAAFPDWLDAQDAVGDAPWLAGLARLDWARSRALFAADGPALRAHDLATLDAGAFGTVSLAWHPATQALWCEDGTPALWLALQAEAAPARAELGSEPQGLLIARPALEMTVRLLSRGGYAFMRACGDGAGLAAAGAAALEAEPGLALAEVFAELIEAGAFAAL